MECVSLLDIVYLTSACLHFIIKIVFVNLRQIFKVRKIIVCLSTITRGMICNHKAIHKMIRWSSNKWEMSFIGIKAAEMVTMMNCYNCMSILVWLISVSNEDLSETRSEQRSLQRSTAA